MSYLLTNGRFQAHTSAGALAVGYLVYTYDSGTTTPKATYSDYLLSSANTNPIVLDARGEAQVRLGSGAYTFVLKTAAGVTVWTEDGIEDTGKAETDTLRTELEDLIDAFEFSYTGYAWNVGIGGTPNSNARLTLNSLTSRDGWTDGKSLGLQVDYSADDNAPPGSNPLHHGIRVNADIEAGVTEDARVWAITGVAEDYSDTGSVTVGVTGIGRRHYGDSRTWGGQFVGVDYVPEVDLAASTHNVYGIECDMEADGDDSFGRRIIAHLTFQRVDFGAGHTGVVGDHRQYCGVNIMAQTADAWFGIRLTSPGAAEIDTAIYVGTQGKRGVSIGGDFTEYGVLVEATSTSAVAEFASAGTAPHGFWANGTYSTAAFRSDENKWWMMGADTGGTSEQVRMRFNSGTRKIEFYRGTNRVGYIDITGADHAL